ncbi:MAG: 50S ribosomal protein L7/L12 [Bacilli bacterium]|jgi:large subunit ribosomal protein L7/L12
MAKIKKEEFIESLKEMTLLEIKELVDAMMEEFGVDPSSVVVPTTTTEAVIEEAPSSVNVVLLETGANKIQVIKLIREITGLGLKDAKDLADTGGNVKENIKPEEAEELKVKLEEVGAKIEIK